MRRSILLYETRRSARGTPPTITPARLVVAKIAVAAAVPTDTVAY
jgi:hypothetical protein